MIDITLIGRVGGGGREVERRWKGAPPPFRLLVSSVSVSTRSGCHDNKIVS